MLEGAWNSLGLRHHRTYTSYYWPCMSMLCHWTTLKRNKLAGSPIYLSSSANPKTAYSHTNCLTQKSGNRKPLTSSLLPMLFRCCCYGSVSHIVSTFTLPTYVVVGCHTKLEHCIIKTTINPSKQNYLTLKQDYKYAKKAKSYKRQTPVQKWPFQGHSEKWKWILQLGQARRRVRKCRDGSQWSKLWF